MNFKNTKVYYLGQQGSYSFMAAINYFKNYQNLKGCESFEEIFNNLLNNKRAYGIIPIENSLTGSITQNYDLLIKSNNFMVGEIYIKINHLLLAGRDRISNISKLRNCFSHPEAIKQCNKFFMKYQNITPVFAKDTASAGKMLTDKNFHNCCAIANRYVAVLNNLKIIKKNIQDDSNNLTRFAVLANKIRRNGPKATIIFKVDHKPGSLYRTLAPYAEMDINLTKIESRPIIGKPWEYIFIVDFIFKNTHSLNYLLNKMRRTTNYLKLLGCYSEGVSYES